MGSCCSLKEVLQLNGSPGYEGHTLLLEGKTGRGCAKSCGCTWKAKSLTSLEGQASLARLPTMYGCDPDAKESGC